MRIQFLRNLSVSLLLLVFLGSPQAKADGDAVKDRAHKKATAWLAKNLAGGPTDPTLSKVTGMIDRGIKATKGFSLLIGSELTKSGHPVVLSIVNRQFLVSELSGELAKNLDAAADEARFLPYGPSELRLILPLIYFIGRPDIENAASLSADAPITGEVQFKRAREVKATYSLRMHVLTSKGVRTSTMPLGKEFVAAEGIQKLPISFDPINVGKTEASGPTMIFFDVAGYRKPDRSGTPVLVSNTLAVPVKFAASDSDSVATSRPKSKRRTSRPKPLLPKMSREAAIEVFKEFADAVEQEEDASSSITAVEFTCGKLDDDAMVRVGAAMRSLPKLAFVYMNHMDTDKLTRVGLAHIRAMTQLEVLQGLIVTDDMMPIIGTLTGLRSLGGVCADGDFRHVTDDGLKAVSSLKNLEDLNLTASNITDKGMRYLAPLTKLKTLKLNDTNITGAGLVYLKGMTQIESLSLYDSKVTDAGLAGLKEISSLKTLRLDGTSISDAGLTQIVAAAPRLEVIHFEVTKLTGTGLEGITTLTEIHAGGSAFSDAGMEKIKDCKSLKLLNLSGSSITDAGLVHLGNLKDLEMLDVSYTRVSREAVMELRNSMPKCQIRM